VSHGIHPISPGEIINKEHKVVVISNRCYLGRSLNICVNIVKNPLSAMNRDAKFHLGLLTDDAKLVNSNLLVLGPFNKSYFARACKGFSPICSSLMCHSRVQSSSVLIEVATCPITVFPLK